MSKSYTGKIIISRHNLPDPNFRETVVFMIEHNDQGAFGLIVNRKLEFPVQEALPHLDGIRARTSMLFLGGPVQKEVVLALHDGTEIEGGEEIIPGVFFEPSFERLFPFFLERNVAARIKTFIGYSGWGPGQLEAEMNQDTWIVLPGDQDLVFTEKSEQGWREALRAKGGLYRVFAETTANPEYN